MGARGPAPDLNALRRDRKSDQSGWTTLPASYDGPVPLWPLAGRQLLREKALWADIWRKPQAAMWAQMGLVFEVGLYVRRLTEVERRDAPTNLGTLVKQMAEELGISQTGLNRHRWKIATDEMAPKRGAQTPARSSVKDRLKLVGEAADA